MLTKEQKEFYEENGYLMVEDVVDPEQLAKLQAITAEMIEESRSVTESDARYDLDVSGTGDVFLTSPEGPLVEQLVAAIEAETGRTPALTTGGGTSDARFIKDLCPVVEFGPVNKTIHAIDEHVPVSELVQLTAIYRRFIEGFFKAV